MHVCMHTHVCVLARGREELRREEREGEIPAAVLVRGLASSLVNGDPPEVWD